MSDNVFEQFTSLGNDPELLVDEKEPYQAITRGKDRQLKLLMYGRNGQVIGMPSYAYYMDIVCESHQSISLIYTHYAYLIQGANLLSLLPLFQDDKARVLRCFNSKLFAEPSSKEPLITKIQRVRIQEIME